MERIMCYCRRLSPRAFIRSVHHLGLWKSWETDLCIDGLTLPLRSSQFKQGTVNTLTQIRA